MFTKAGFEAAFAYWPMFLEGVLGTVLLSAFAVFFGFIIAMMLALCRMCKVAPLRWLATAYVEVFRATPMLVQVLLIYNISLLAFPDMPSYRIFGLFIFRRFVPGVVALSLNSGAYLSEVIRSGISSIPIGQTEAARTLGMSGAQTTVYVIIPQMFRNVIPTMTSEFILLYKDTSLLAAVGVMEVVMYAKTIVASTGSITPYIVAAIFYLIVTLPLARVVGMLEARLSGEQRGGKAQAAVSPQRTTLLPRRHKPEQVI